MQMILSFEESNLYFLNSNLLNNKSHFLKNKSQTDRSLGLIYFYNNVKYYVDTVLGLTVLMLNAT